MLCAKAPPAFYEIKVHTSHSLPIGQGFGLSAAGALSAASALRAAINSTLTNRLAGQSTPRSLLTEDAAVAAAHCAEVELLTGLGDVVAEAVGGIPIRVKAGAPPHCELQQLWEFQKNTVDTNLEIVLCVLDAPRPTHTILSNSMLREKICRYGKLCLQKLLEQPALENMFSLANSFAKKTGLLTDAAAAALAAVKRARGMGAMALLGNAIFALSSDNAKLAECLQAHGTVYRMPLSKPTATLPHYTLSHHVYRKLSH
jgi:pantoate kinase